MFRFFVCVWNPADTAAIVTAALVRRRLHAQPVGWQQALRRDGLQVLYTGARPGSMDLYPLPADSGVVLGKVFTAHADAGFVDAASRLAERSTTARLLHSGGRELITSFWGRYVAVLRARNQGWCIVRAPASALPCYRAQFGGVHLFFSDVESCAALRLIRFTIDWKLIASQLVAATVGAATGLNEVREVLPGECIRIDAAGSSAAEYWNPGTIASTDVVESVATATTLARATVRDCVHAWASAYASIIHNLSGGLDSSIVLACLHDAPSKPRIQCVIHYSEGAASDGRTYARAVARHLGRDLLEQKRVETVDLRMTLSARRSARPERCVRRAEHSLTEAQLAAEARAGAIFTGDGGDELFHRNEPILAAADFACLHGIRPRLLALTLQGALAQRVSFWNVLQQALRHRLVKGEWDIFSEVYAYKTLIDDDLLETIRRERACRSSWSHSTRIAPPGKLFHIYTLTAPRNYYDPLGRETDPEFVSPLLSQPLVELFLRIPTYVLKEGGWDRAIARRAFTRDLPPEVAWRRSKGGIEEHAASIMKDNLPFLRSMLLDGRLAGRGLLNRPRLEEALSGRPSSAWKGPSDVFNLLATELWLRSWESYSVDEPAELVA